MASAGCRKNAGVPVLESVAAILRQMMPDLPMPVTMTRPRQFEQDPHGLFESLVEPIDERQDRGRLGLQDLAREREIDGCDARHARAPDAAAVVSRAAASIAFELHDERLEPVEPQRVGGVALRLRGIVVHFHEHGVDARGHAGRRQRLDVLREAGGDAVARARAAAGCA